MIVHCTRALSGDCVAAFMARFDAGSTGALIRFYTGSMPTATLPYTGPETGITSQTLLGTLTCQKPSGSITTGTLTLFPITQDDAADADGTTTWARILDSNSNAVVDVDCGTVGSGAAIQMPTTALLTGGPISITSATIRLP